MMNLKLSIVTSFYNCSRFIDELAKSILSQNYTNWEWIICDDFSDDDTPAKLEQLLKKAIAKGDNRIKLVTQEYKKQIWWNPQTYATGDIICPIDGDDKILPNTFEKIVHYFNQFPDVVLMHFNANKYNDILPMTSDDIFDSFHDNVYISRDNVSFLDAFERLWPNRSNIFGYLRIFRNLPGLRFNEYPDDGICSSNDGQWLLMVEEMGQCLAIPRTTYLARQHGNSENFRNWNIRGEVKLIADANKRRQDKGRISTISHYFDDVYVAAESTYLSKLNWENGRKKLCFIGYDYGFRQREKLRELFFEHSIAFFEYDEHIGDDELFHYIFIRVRYDSTADSILRMMNKVNGDITLFCDNIHLHHNNRTGANSYAELKETLNLHYTYFLNEQDNRGIITCLHKLKTTTVRKVNIVGPQFMSAEMLIKIYEETEMRPRGKRKPDNKIAVTFIDGPKVTITGTKVSSYVVKFINNDTGVVEYTSEELRNTDTDRLWAACAIKYLVNWKIEIWEKGKLLDTHYFNPEGKTVRIHFGSSSLGDNIAWIPYVEEFRKKHKCKVLCSTWKNGIFDEAYPDIKFIKASDIIYGVYACFNIGWYYRDDDPMKIDFYRNKRDFRAIPLQATASDTLGLKYVEIVTLVNKKIIQMDEHEPYVCIAPHASAHAKYWNNVGGWQNIIDRLNNKGYKVIYISSEKLGDKHQDDKLGGRLTNVIDMSGDQYPLQHRIECLRKASLFIGVGSGLSWLAWTTGVPVVLISGFSEEYTEFQHNCHRVINKDVCHGCFNVHKLDAADWEWCPNLQWTSRHYECTKSILPEQVMSVIDNILFQ